MNKKDKISLTFHKLDWLEYITIFLGLWFVFYPHPYEVLFATLLFIPILGLFLNGLNGKPSIASLVRITKDDDNSDEYDVADFIDFSAYAIIIRVIKDFDFDNLTALIIPGFITFLVVLSILFLTHKVIESNNKKKWWIYSHLVFNIFLFSFSATYGINCVFDYSEPKVYSTNIIDKRISKSRRSTTYYLKVKPWKNKLDTEEISVSRAQYDSLQINDTVKIDLKKGLLEIPWYYVE